MSDITTAPPLVQIEVSDPLALRGAYGSNAYTDLAPGRGFSSAPILQSSDAMVRRNRETAAADARDVSRSDPYAHSAVRSKVDAVVGARFNLQLSPDWSALGVTSDEAAEWAEMVEERFLADAMSVSYGLDAQRKQTWSGLMRTAYASRFVDGEMLGTIEWKRGLSRTRTCLNIIHPSRLSNPMGVTNWQDKVRMGVERDREGAPLAYHIRERLPSDMVFGVQDQFTWKRIPRYTPWGRQNVIHSFEHDAPDMTRGLTGFTSALLPMRLLRDYMMTELESAAVKATYAAVIESDLDYEKAMAAIGSEMRDTLEGNPVLDLTTKMMADRLSFYKGQDVRFGKSKIAHLLPNEKLNMVQGNAQTSAVRDFSEVNLYTLASALGVDYSTLTKDFSSVNYSGARAALFDVWRSYEVERSSHIEGVAMPFVQCWMEEKIALTNEIPMLGNASFYEVRDAVCRGTFETWNKPQLDPAKETGAALIEYQAGVLSLKEWCAQGGKDWRKVLDDRAREKAYMKTLGLKPEDIDWTLIMNQGKKPGQPAQGGSSGDSGGTGSNN